jgi:hypothetical protein
MRHICETDPCPQCKAQDEWMTFMSIVVRNYSVWRVTRAWFLAAIWDRIMRFYGWGVSKWVR